MRTVALLLLPALLAAQTPPATQTPPKVEPARLEGKVVSAATGEPLRRANVTLFPFGPRTTTPRGAVTQADGAFVFEAVEPGSYRLAAERQGHVRMEYGARGGSGSSSGQLLTIASGQTLKDLTFRLTPHAVISGKVTDDEGEAMANVGVMALRPTYLQGRRQFIPAGQAATNDLGEFRVAGLAPGHYLVAAQAQPRGMGLPMAQAPRSDSSEEFVSTYYPSVLDEAAATRVETAAGGAVSGIDIRLRKARVHTIRGRVVPLAGETGPFHVMLRAPDGDFGPFRGAQGAATRTPEFTFELPGVRPGSYVVQVSAMRGGHVVGRLPIEVGDRPLDQVVVTQQPVIELKGTVQIEGAEKAALPEATGADGRAGAFVGLGQGGNGSSTAPAEKQSSVHITLFPADSMLSFSPPSARALVDGSFTLARVSPDRYRLSARVTGQELYVKTIRFAGQDMTDSGLDLSQGAAGGLLEVVLSRDVAEVTGVVRDEKGQPMPGAMVTLVPDASFAGRTDRFRFMSTDQTGAFRLNSLPPGKYRVFAWESIEPGMAMDAEFLKGYEGKGQWLTLSEKARQAVTLTALPTPP